MGILNSNVKTWYDVHHLLYKKLRAASVAMSGPKEICRKLMKKLGVRSIVMAELGF